MSRNYRLIFRQDDREDGERQTASLAGLAVTLLILVVCVFLTRQLARTQIIENCLMSGRNNCDMIIPKLK